MAMNVILAESMGMCFGVRDALKKTREVQQPGSVTVYGELVHNREVLDELAQRGFQQTREDQRSQIPATPTVMITAHGISDVMRTRLVEAGKELIDTTCPLVRRVHQAAAQLTHDGFFVLVIGQRGHVEVEGIVQDLLHYEIVGHPDEVRSYPSERLGVICQTTLASSAFQEICTHIQLHNPLAEIRWIDTICDPTHRRQQAMYQLIRQVDAMVVVGGRNSNNTLQLVALCREHDLPVVHVENAAQLDPAWFDPYETVGLTAGTSTLDDTIAEVHRAIVAVGATKMARDSAQTSDAQASN